MGIEVKAKLEWKTEVRRLESGDWRLNTVRLIKGSFANALDDSAYGVSGVCGLRREACGVRHKADQMVQSTVIFVVVENKTVHRSWRCRAP